MDGSLIGEDLSGAIAAAWIISAVLMGALAAYAIMRWRAVCAAEQGQDDE